jgi:hypothetical protein
MQLWFTAMIFILSPLYLFFIISNCQELHKKTCGKEFPNIGEHILPCLFLLCCLKFIFTYT